MSTFRGHSDTNNNTHKHKQNNNNNKNQHNTKTNNCSKLPIFGWCILDC